MMASFGDFCGIGNETFTAWRGNDFGPCFELLALVCPANALLALSSAYFGARRQHGSLRDLPSYFATKFRIASSFVVCLGVMIEIVCSLLLERTHVPVYFLACALVFFAWLLNTCALWNIRHFFLLGACVPRMHLVTVLAAVLGTALQFFSVISGLSDNDWEGNHLGVKDYGVVVRLVVQIVFVLSLIPCQAWGRSVYDYRNAASSVQVPECPEDEHTFLRSISQATFYSSIQCVSDDLGIAETNSNFLSRLSFWWVGPLMLKGSKGKIKTTEDVFILPPSLSTRSLKQTFSWLFDCQDSQPAQDSGDPSSCLTDSQSDYSVQFSTDGKGQTHRPTPSASTTQRTLLNTLHHAFGCQYYCIGILKLLADALGFAGPLLLHALVSFMENPKEPMKHGYYYAAGLFGSVFFGAIANSQFGFWVNKVGLKVRAAIITTVYHKALAVSSTSLSKFSTGEVVNFMSTDTDRVVNFCPSFHQFWSLPLQIAVSLYLLHQQVGVSFLAGLAFAVLLVPVNKWLAIKIQKLSKDMMMQKDARVKVMNEILHGIRVIKFYAWERNFEEKINTLRAAELKSLKGRKYLDAWCVYFWATTPVVISILTFSTYVLLGNELTAAKVFTSVALFNMLISPLNAFPWVLNGLMEAWVSVQRIQAFLSLEDFNPTEYYLEGPPPETTTNPGFGASELMIRNGHFTWKPGNQEQTTREQEEEPERDGTAQNAAAATIGCLSNINLHVKQGQLIGVVGKVGSGKSSLLSAITAEMGKLHGEVFVADLQHGFGFAAQEPWIQHGTVKENILFGKSFDVDKYYETIHACALEEDIRVLPAGDDTEIGENGVTLSGGQKARVALARAVYQDKPLYLLDDPLAAVDAHVAEHLFRHCIMGVLHKKTRILCTHHTKFLAAADVVLVMDQGSVVHCGPPGDVLQLTSVRRQISDTVSHQDELEKEKEQGGDFSGQEEDGALVKEEEKEVGVVKLHVYAAYWLAIGHCLATSILISLLLMQASRNVSDWWLAYWISHSKHQTNSTANPSFALRDVHKDSVSFYLLVYGALAVSNSVFTLFRAFLFAFGGVRAARGLHTRLLRSILSAPVSFFDVTPIGRIINRFSSDIYAIDDSLPFILNIFLAQVYGVVGTVVITCYGLPWIVLLLLPLTLIYYHIQKYYRRTSRELKRLMSVTLSPVYAHFSETLTGLGTIRALRASARFDYENEARLEVNQTANYCALVASQWLGLRLQFLGVAMVTGVAFLAVLEHHFSTVDPGLVGLAISYALSVTDRLSGMVTSFTETEKQMVGVERAVQYIEDVPSENKQHARVPEAWPFSGRLSFMNVSLVYRPGLPPALRNVAFTTAPGEKIGIVGRTGSGKSSLFLVLFRIVEIKSPGRVLLDGVYVDSAPLDVLRSRLAIIPQDAFLFSGSVRLNIDPWEKYSDENLWAVLEKCHLDGAVQELGGLDADVGERGRHFSVGQRQLLCLARALLTRAKVLCIDEATASVDLATDRLIQQTIRREFKDSTVLTIAHRLDTIMDSDRVLVMNQGTVAEFDKPQDLLKNERSLFYALVHSDEGRRQTKG